MVFVSFWINERSTLVFRILPGSRASQGMLHKNNGQHTTESCPERQLSQLSVHWYNLQTGRFWIHGAGPSNLHIWPAPRSCEYCWPAGPLVRLEDPLFGVVMCYGKKKTLWPDKVGKFYVNKQDYTTDWLDSLRPVITDESWYWWTWLSS